MNLTDLSPSDLRRAAQIKEQIDTLTDELSSILTGAGSTSSLNPQPLPPRGGRRMSAAGRARIAAAARARWAKVRSASGQGKGASATASKAGGKRRTMSAAAKAKIAAAARARWAKAKAAGKSRL